MDSPRELRGLADDCFFFNLINHRTANFIIVFFFFFQKILLIIIIILKIIIIVIIIIRNAKDVLKSI